MYRFLEKMLGKSCILYLKSEKYGVEQVSGKISAVNENALLLERGDEREAINLNYLIRVKEYDRVRGGRKTTAEKMYE